MTSDFSLSTAAAFYIPIVWPIFSNCGYAVVMRVPLSNRLINNAKIHQAVTTESPPFPGSYATSDYVACNIEKVIWPTINARASFEYDNWWDAPAGSYLSSTEAMRNTAGKVYSCVSVAAGLNSRQ